MEIPDDFGKMKKSSVKKKKKNRYIYKREDNGNKTKIVFGGKNVILEYKVSAVCFLGGKVRIYG